MNRYVMNATRLMARNKKVPATTLSGRGPVTAQIVATPSTASPPVLLTIVESGFDRIPIERRAKVFEMNDGGWTAQTELIAKYLRDAA